MIITGACFAKINVISTFSATFMSKLFLKGIHGAPNSTESV